MTSEREHKTQQKINEIRSDVSSRLKKWERPQWGYTKPPEPERKEGDVWEDSDGKQWTVKNGIRQSITKLQDAKTPWFCPMCERVMNHRFDQKMYWLHNRCYNCTIEMHTQMILDGTWDAYEKQMLRENEKSFLRDKISEHKEYMRTFKVPQVHFENGGWEEIAKLEHFTELFETLKEDIKFCENRLKEIEAEEQNEQATNKFE